jgi:molybdopterin synthase sulfur carrier subunit
MNITVRYFASMRDRMGRADEVVSVEGDLSTVAEVWSKVSGGKPMPDSTLIAVNMAYTDSAATLKDGDELAFFPPVTGG